MISVPHDAKGWARLMEWVNDPVLLADPELVDEGKRQLKRDFILDRLSEWSKKNKKIELVMQAQNLHIPASPVATVLDLASDPQLIARGFLREIEHPQLGKIMFPVGATGRAESVTLKPAPTLGQHTLAILRELGYSSDEARAFAGSGGT